MESLSDPYFMLKYHYSVRNSHEIIKRPEPLIHWLRVCSKEGGFSTLVVAVVSNDVENHKLKCWLKHCRMKLPLHPYHFKQLLVRLTWAHRIVILIVMVFFGIYWNLLRLTDEAPLEDKTTQDEKISLLEWPTCDKIIAGEVTNELLSSLSFGYSPAKPKYTSCDKLTRFNGRHPWVSVEEQDFPLAYIITTYESYQRLARLLRLIYRRHNIYCVHIDATAPESFASRVHQLVNCYGSNVLLVPSSERVNVIWGEFSVLEANLVCAEMLIRSKKIQWQYVLNVNEKELPLRTNWEMVKAMKALNGSNLVQYQAGNWTKRIPKTKLPFNVTWYKGSFLVALRRDFVVFMLRNPKALAILDALQSGRGHITIPDEMFFSTLAYNPHLGAPGACLYRARGDSTDPRTMFLIRYVSWKDTTCHTKRWRNEVCLLGLKHLPMMIKAPQLFANKFTPTVQPEAYDCMEYWLIRKLIREQDTHSLDRDFNDTVFAQLYCSTSHI
ncbi:Core-2/I-Branching enzyme [Opisthorchis viverrini]|nr:Core-2/I-Branching enzyme [Opisthorchis viverrini]